MEFYHQSVLLDPIIAAFKGLSLKVFVDGTLGAGGHAEAMLRSHPEIELLLGIDQDPDALKIAGKRLAPWESKARLQRGNYSEIEAYVTALGIKSCEGILLDLGVSSMQLDRPEKGFSFTKEGPLDMRMDPTNDLTAADVVNGWTEQELGRVFRVYGEEKRWRAAARAVAEARKKSRIASTLDLVKVLEPVLSPRFKKKGIHPMTLIFQALRICVNRELEKLEEALPKMIRCLAAGGRLAVISFHSLEDRIVKNVFRYAASDKESTRGIAGVFQTKTPEVIQVTRKPIVASPEEIRANPRSRSAKLRIVEKAE